MLYLLLVPANSIKTITLDKGNNVVLSGQITEQLADDFIFSIIKNNPKYVYISSQGGSIMAGNRIISQLQQMNITCIAEKAYSMAFVILQACTNRYVTHVSTVMQHQASLGIYGNIYPITNYLKMIHAIEQKLTQLQADRINIGKDEFRALTTTEWWLFGEDILSNNVADEIVNVKCTQELLSTSIVNKKYGMFMDEYIETYSACPLISQPLEIEYKDMIRIDYKENKENEQIATNERVQTQLKNWKYDL